ncbi:membrane integrity-associated transporter subunit PqiC [Phaeovulum sp.]|uniref:PqiC family protein n=1 Tax=Phaeovulum sp. TaxID=2934796 RepID=UPI0039E701D8
MTMTRFALVALTLVAACSNPEKTGRYMIDPPATEKQLPDMLGLTELREVSLPQYASGQEIAYQTEDGALRSRPDQIWADDPARAITQALARQISSVSGATVVAEPWPLAAEPQRRLEVRVEQMLAHADGVMRLSGQYFVSPAGYGAGRDVVRRFDLSIPIEGTGPAAIAAAQSRAIKRLAEQIARLG